MEEYIEHAYFKALVDEGLDPDVLMFIEEMAALNYRTTTYFIMQALEDFKAHLDQDEGFSEISFTSHH